VLVRTGEGMDSLEKYRESWRDIEADFIANNVLEGAKWVVNQE
jgi:hypothetical protein